MNVSIAAIILTKNEEKHIARCLESLKGVCGDNVVCYNAAPITIGAALCCE